MRPTLTVMGSRRSAPCSMHNSARIRGGVHTLEFAGIDSSTQKFTPDTSDYQEKQRVAVVVAGAVRHQSRWTFGWDALWQSDNNFARTIRCSMRPRPPIPTKSI